MWTVIVHVTTLAVLVYGTVVDGTSILKNCCDVAEKSDSYFSISIKHPTVYHIIDYCAQRPVTQGYCDTITDGGGWLVVQRRRWYGREDFHRSWSEYEWGFGHLHSQYWYGLRSLYCLTNRETFELRIDLTFENGTKSYLHYNNFRVGSPSSNYQLSISGFTGYSGEDPFATHSLNGQQFSTHDRANDPGGYCVIEDMAVEHQVDGGITTFYINLNYRIMEDL